MRGIRRLFTALAVLAAAIAATLAYADVAIYKNGFGTHEAVNAIKQLGGGKCKRDWHDQKALSLKIDGGRGSCVYRTPVEGDSKQPNYTISASANVLRDIDKKLRRNVYAGLAVRTNAKGGYVLRVFPKGRRWQFLRNGEIIENGKDKAIKPLGKKNFLYIGVDKDMVRFGLKRRALGSYEDPKASELKGKRTAVIVGNVKQAKKDAVVVFDNLKVQVPEK